MHLQDKDLLFEVVPGATLAQDVQKLRELAAVAGLGVRLTVKGGVSMLCVGYNEEFTEFIRNRKAGRPRKTAEVQITCGEVFATKEAQGSKAVAARLRMPLATFYRRCDENKGKGDGEPFT